MDIQSAPPPSATAPNMSVVGVPPQLGAPVPGATGGLPALSGLSIAQNPMAEALRSKGRGDDTMLVHMTPNEVNSLQGLAMAAGGSLTINPETGLPEAGWLGKLLPTILGGVLAATGVGAPLAAGIVGLGQTALTGDLQKGLMAGLGAFGGASLAGAAGLGGTISKNAFGVLSDKAGLLGANMGAGLSTAPAIGKAAEGTLEAAFDSTFPGKTGIGGVIDKFGKTAARGLPGGIISKAAPFVAAQGLVSGISSAATPTGGYPTQEGKIDNSYQGPYYSPQRQATFAPSTQDLLASSKERRYFDVGMPEVRNVQGQLVQPGSSTAPGTPLLQNVLNPNAKKGEPMYMQQYTPFMGAQGMGYAEGGEVEMEDGAFVVDARTVSELGNGSSEAGQELLAKMGGRPIKGPGDGVSDSIPARIGNDQPARVARDEVLFSAGAVKKLGKGSEKRGAQKLYALMDKAHKARRESARGKDSKLRKGLA